MLYISYKAQKHFFKLLKNKIDTKIKISIINNNKNMDYKIYFCKKNEIKLSDIKIKYNFISIYVDKFSIKYLKHLEIDLITNNLNTQLTLKNNNPQKPKIKSKKKLFKLINLFLQNYINPKLMYHKGKVTLHDIQDNKYVILKFHGGCNGCSMINFTLKNNIENKILKEFPEIIKVLDITKHKYGIHSYTNKILNK